MKHTTLEGILIILWLASAWLGHYLGRQRGRPATGCLAGLLLGPIGWVLVALERRGPCPHCRQIIDSRATVCPHCQQSNRR